MYFSRGIFIWWLRESHPNVTSYTIQFWQNDTSNPTVFSDQVIGTTVPLSDYAASEDVEPNFVKINATTNIYSRSLADSIGDLSMVGPNGQLSLPSKTATNIDDSDRHVHNETITEVRVPGNVTGILIPNTKRIVVRVFIPIVYENKEFYQDNRFVQWRLVSQPQAPVGRIILILPIVLVRFIYAFCQFEETPSHMHLIRVAETESRGATFYTSNKSIKCIRACYKDTEQKCQDM